MQSKTAFVEKYLLDRIHSGEFAPGCKIPSQHQLMYQCKCSRITVQRALKLLVQNGFLHTGKGSGTFVLPGPYSSLREIIVVVERNPQLRPAADIIPQILPVRWIDANFATRHCEKFFTSGQLSGALKTTELHINCRQKEEESHRYKEQYEREHPLYPFAVRYPGNPQNCNKDTGGWSYHIGKSVPKLECHYGSLPAHTYNI